MNPGPAPDQFYTGLVSELYAPLRSAPTPPEPYARFVRRYGEPALEIGCGHGEPLLDLVAEGLDVTGVDSSADMIERCRAAATARGFDVALAVQRMQDLDLGRTFASIYFAGPTFQLVLDLDEACRTLERLRAHLQSDGAILLPLFVPEPVDPATIGQWTESTDHDGTSIGYTVISTDYRAEERRVDSVLRYRRRNSTTTLDELDRTWSLRWYAPGELETLTANAGLAVLRDLVLGPSARTLTLGRVN